MAEASSSAPVLSQLIDSLMEASTSATDGDVESVEKTLELFESLKKMKVDPSELHGLKVQLALLLHQYQSISCRDEYCIIASRSSRQQ